MELTEELTVSDGNVIIYYPVYTTVSGSDSAPEETVAETVYTLWDKPIDAYTPTEGMLLFILCMLGVMLINKFMGGFKWLR